MTQPDYKLLFSHPAHFFGLGFGSGLAPKAPGELQLFKIRNFPSPRDSPIYDRGLPQIPGIRNFPSPRASPIEARGLPQIPGIRKL